MSTKIGKILRKEVSTRWLLYVIIGSSWLLCLIVLLLTDYPIVEGLFTEATGVVVAVFLIDLLLRAERAERLKKTNALNAKGVELDVSIAAARIAKLVGYEDFPTFDDATTEQYKAKIEEMTKSAEWHNYMAQYKTLNKKIIRLIKLAEPVIEKNRKMISDSMHEAYPAPNPLIIEKIDRIHSEMLGRLSARQQIVEVILVEVPKKFNGFKDRSAKDKKIWKDGTEVLWAKVMNDEDGLGSIEGYFKSLLNDYTLIKEQARDNNLHFDV
jgi:hypothetical protein